jgi:AAA15 family ATPase/GTPase
MIERLRIDGFRGFDDLCIDEFGQFNLIVGPGNVGKTNLLEALFLFCGSGDGSLLPKVLGMRRIDPASRSPKQVLSTVGWFWSVGSKKAFFEIAGIIDGKKRAVRITKLAEESEISLRSTDEQSKDEVPGDALARYQVETRIESSVIKGNLTINPKSITFKVPSAANVPARYVSPLELGDPHALAAIWSQAEERDEQGKIESLLRTLDPEIEEVRIGADEFNRAFVILRHKRLKRPPLEIFGSGFGKALAIACYISAQKDGILLIDELDASLHVGAQAVIIEFLLKTAEAHNVQVFASTHSLETVDAFLDAYHDMKSEALFARPEGLRVLQLKRIDNRTKVESLAADRALGLREEMGFDLRRT